MEKNILSIIENHPNGSLFTRTRGEKTYYYLNYRDGNKVISEYLGTPKTIDIELLSKKLYETKHLISYANAINKFNQATSSKVQKQKSDFLHDMFKKIKSIDFFDIPALVANASSDEEKAFVQLVAEFSIQLKQDIAIKEHRF